MSTTTTEPTDGDVAGDAAAATTVPAMTGLSRADRRRQEQRARRFRIPVLWHRDPYAPRRRRKRSESQRRRAAAVSMSLAILAVLCLGFVLTISVLGSLKLNRDQITAYDDFRYELANGTAPVGQTDEAGQLVPLGTTVAVVRIPALGLDAVGLEGTTSGVTMSGLGHRRDTVLPGQGGTSVFYGRRAAFGGLLADVGSLPLGATITTQSGAGEASYTVVSVRRAGDPVPPAAQKGRLSLVTAAGRPYLPDDLLIVDADLQTDPQPSNPRVLSYGSLPTAEQAMAGDSSAWFPLLLWAQALLLFSVLTVVAWARWGRWEAWLIGLPVLVVVGVATASQAAQLLPNLM